MYKAKITMMVRARETAKDILERAGAACVESDYRADGTQDFIKCTFVFNELNLTILGALKTYSSDNRFKIYGIMGPDKNKSFEINTN